MITHAPIHKQPINNTRKIPPPRKSIKAMEQILELTSTTHKSAWRVVDMTKTAAPSRALLPAKMSMSSTSSQRLASTMEKQSLTSSNASRHPRLELMIPPSATTITAPTPTAVPLRDLPTARMITSSSTEIDAQPQAKNLTSNASIHPPMKVSLSIIPTNALLTAKQATTAVDSSLLLPACQGSW